MFDTFPLKAYNDSMNGVVENVRVVVRGNETRAARLAFSEGRITARDEACPTDWPRTDGHGLLLLPGVIDPHTHFDDPGYTDHEDFTCGTRGAITGGVTTICDMPDTSVPPVTTRFALRSKIEAVEPKAFCDFALWGGVSANALEDPRWVRAMSELRDDGVIGIKTYTCSGMDSFRHLSWEQYPAVLVLAAELGLPVGVHAEDASIIFDATQRVLDRTDTYAWYLARPVKAEVEAIQRVAAMAKQAGSSIHIVHLSSGSGAAAVADFQKEGIDISAETCPQYLAFNVDDFCRLGSILKCAPSVKTAEEQRALWLFLGTAVSILATDHAPCPIVEKQTGNIFSDYAGMPGVELLLPFIMTYGYHAGVLTLEQIISLTSANAARRFGLYPRKGCLEPGADADFVLIDPARSFCVDAAKLQSKGKYTPFHGQTFYGRVRQTWLRGTRVYNDGDYTGPTGHFIARNREK